MIDFIKLLIPAGDLKSLKENIHLTDWVTKFRPQTGDIKWEEAKNHEIKVRIIYTTWGTFAEVSLSLHKLFQAGTNFRRFPYSELFQSIQMLWTKYQINPATAIIRSFEFGVNLYSPPCSSDTLLKNYVDYLGKAKEIATSENRFSKFVKLQRYSLKVYNKAKQYREPGEILRFEIHIDRMLHIQKTGIKCLADLLSVEKLHSLLPFLEKAAGRMIIKDHRIKSNSLTASEKKICSVSAEEMNDLRMNDKRRFKHFCKRLKEISLNHSGNTVNDILRQAISQEWNSLLNDSPEMGYTVSGFLKSLPERQSEPEFSVTGKDLPSSLKLCTKLTGLVWWKNCPKLTGFSAHCFHPDLSQINTLNMGLNCEPPQTYSNSVPERAKVSAEKIPSAGVTSTQRACKSCGRDISNQQPRSRFCSERIHGPEAKKCRNMDSNRKKQRRQKYGTNFGGRLQLK